MMTINDDGPDTDFLDHIADLGHLESKRNIPLVKLMKACYEAGWLASADWAERDDLQHDIGSYAYNMDRTKFISEMMGKLLEE